MVYSGQFGMAFVSLNFLFWSYFLHSQYFQPAQFVKAKNN